METKFDLILKGGHIIDPASGINSSMDLAISGGIIGLVEKIYHLKDLIKL